MSKPPSPDKSGSGPSAGVSTYDYFIKSRSISPKEFRHNNCRKPRGHSDLLLESIIRVVGTCFRGQAIVLFDQILFEGHGAEDGVDIEITFRMKGCIKERHLVRLESIISE